MMMLPMGVVMVVVATTTMMITVMKEVMKPATECYASGRRTAGAVREGVGNWVAETGYAVADGTGGHSLNNSSLRPSHVVVSDLGQRSTTPVRARVDSRLSQRLLTLARVEVGKWRFRLSVT